MSSKAWLFGIILCVPIIGFCVAEGIQAYFNSQLRSALKENINDVNSNALSRISIDDVCKEPDPELSDLCETNRNLNLMSNGAIAAGAIGLALLLIIRIAGTIARNNRRLLLYFFKPGLYLTALTLVGLMIVHAAIAMAAIYYGESALFGRIHIWIIGAIGLGALAGIAVLIRNVFSLIHDIETKVIGLTVSQEQAPELWQQVKDVANRLGALNPEQIVLGLDPNFFVTEADVLCIDGKLSGRTLYCSLPLCRMLSKDELSAVIGHELGHFKGFDTKFSQKFFPIYRGTASAIVSLQETGGEGSSMIALLPAIAILSYFLECFSVAESRISRIRELEADKEGAVVSSETAMVSSLVKLHAFSGAWSSIEEATIENLHKGKAFVNISKTFAEAMPEKVDKGLLEKILETHLVHPTDSHPPLSERLKSLQFKIEAMAENAFNIDSTKAAINLIPNAESHEESISAAYQSILNEMLSINYGSEETEDHIENKDDVSNELKCNDCGLVVNEKNLDSDQLLCPECRGRLEYV